MKYLVLAFTAFHFCSVFVGNAQVNLVPNGSFEEMTECPNGPGASGLDQLEKCFPWFKPNEATTDVYNACANTDPNYFNIIGVPSNWMGWQEAFDGDGYVGLCGFIPNNNNGAEYASVRLIKKLKPCGTYQVRFWISLSDYSTHAINTIGARFDRVPLSSITYLGFELPAHISNASFIMDTTNWILISGMYEAEGEEEYLTIGRFFDTLHYSNTTVPNIPNDCDSCFAWHPVANYYVDSVSVIELSYLQESKQITNVFTPNLDHVNELWYPNHVCFDTWICEIFNRWGQEVFSFKKQEIGWSGKDLTDKELDDGVYFYRISNGEDIETGYVHLIRN
jgi:gliding motility-associated-like protein